MPETGEEAAEDLRAYLARAFDYAKIALRDGQAPAGVIDDLYAQLRVYETSEIHRFDVEAVANAARKKRRQRDNDLAETTSGLLVALVAEAEANQSAAVSAKAIEQARLLVHLIGEGRAALPLVERAQDRLGELAAVGEIESAARQQPELSDRDTPADQVQVEPRTLIETVDGAEFGSASWPAAVIEQILAAGGKLTQIELAHGDDSVWINPGLVSIVRAGEMEGLDG